MSILAAVGTTAAFLTSIAVAEAPASAVAPSVLIGELRFEGPAGIHDGYVDLYNPGPSTVTLSGWSLGYAYSGGETGPLHS